MLKLLTAALVTLAPAAHALSCMAPNFADDFNRVAAAKEVYALVYGQIRDAGPIPEYEQGKPREVVMAFVGKQMGSRGLGETQAFPVTIETECASAWCGPIPTLDTQMLAFIQETEGGYRLTSHTCPTDFFLNPSLGQISAIRACMTEGTCGDDEKSAFDLN